MVRHAIAIVRESAASVDKVQRNDFAGKLRQVYWAILLVDETERWHDFAYRQHLRRIFRRQKFFEGLKAACLRWLTFGAVVTLDRDTVGVGIFLVHYQDEIDHRARAKTLQHLGIQDVDGHNHPVHETGNFATGDHHRVMGKINL